MYNGINFLECSVENCWKCEEVNRCNSEQCHVGYKFNETSGACMSTCYDTGAELGGARSILLLPIIGNVLFIYVRMFVPEVHYWSIMVKLLKAWFLNSETCLHPCICIAHNGNYWQSTPKYTDKWSIPISLFLQRWHPGGRPTSTYKLVMERKQKSELWKHVELCWIYLTK